MKKSQKNVRIEIPSWMEKEIILRAISKERASRDLIDVLGNALLELKPKTAYVVIDKIRNAGMDQIFIGLGQKPKLVKHLKKMKR